jgi:hypothetical protein
MKRAWKALKKMSFWDVVWRLTSRKLWIILSFAAIGIYLNELGRLSDALAHLLGVLATVYCASNVWQKGKEKEKDKE